ncbi:uncharacterized protein LOC128376898 [Scomber japonicus]|uniref:uncharacterized protein LOC128376898 n=1 Tax=Scomber japonicus TaxID=13676 RepID=UPI002305ACF1|nr:uncharacterized protein LOC128376898 [Scomber japonicus]
MHQMRAVKVNQNLTQTGRELRETEHKLQKVLKFPVAVPQTENLGVQIHHPELLDRDNRLTQVPNIQKIATTSPACASLMSAMRPLLTCHCTAAFNPLEQYKPPHPAEYGPPSELSEVPSYLWAKHKNHVGFVNSAPPHKVTLKPNVTLPAIRQYNLPHRAITGIETVIQSLLDQNVLVQTSSPCNTPILPIPKPNRPDEWRFVQDLQAINNIVVPTAPIVPDTNSILASLPSNSTHYTVIDLCSAFFSIPLHPDSQYLFTFTFKGKQYTWRRLPQGYVESPTVYAAAVKRDLDDLHFPGGSTLLQYADDLLIASPSEEACRTDSILLLQRLAECGHRASLPKLQFCRSEVTYFGHLLKDGQRLLSPERVKLLVNMPPPRTKKGMLSFLGMANYCRHWIYEYAAMDSVLRAATLQSAPTAVQWTDDMQKAFQNLKHALTMAPALGLPDYHQPFHLHVHEREGFATGILVQKHGSHYRPVAYYSSRLTPVVLGMPGCLRAVAAVAILLDKSAPIVLAHDCVVHVPHAVLHILNTSATQHMTAARRSGYEATILSSPHITLKRSPPLNPATLLPLIDTTEIEHDCIATIDMCTSPRPDLLQTPIPNSEMILYTDGSASRPSDNVHLAGYAVVNDWEVLEARALPPGTSAQAAELYALTRACIIASGKTATIYTDSRYAFGVAHDFGQLWKMRGFVSSSGRPLQHHALVNDLLDAIMRPFQLAIVKCAAHSQENDPVSRGNAMADFAAKQAATSSSSMVERTVPGAADNQDSIKGGLGQVTGLKVSGDGEQGGFSAHDTVVVTESSKRGCPLRESPGETNQELASLSKVLESHLNASSRAMLAEHKELQEVKTVVLQNRMALDLLLASQGGTCIFGPWGSNLIKLLTTLLVIILLLILLCALVEVPQKRWREFAPPQRSQEEETLLGFFDDVGGVHSPAQVL